MDAVTLVVNAFQVPHDETGREMLRRKLKGIDTPIDAVTSTSGLKKHRSRTVLIWVCVLIALGYLVAVPGPTYETTYRSAFDDPTEEPTYVHRTESPRKGKKQYILQDDTLYLEVERVRRGAFFKFIKYDFVTEWTVPTVWKFRMENPAMEGYWPDASKENGGVLWIEERVH